MTITQPTYTITTSNLVDYLGGYSDTVALNAQTGTAYTLVLADRGKLITCSNAAANTVTVPQNSSVALPIGSIITVVQLSAGTTSFVAGTGATIISRGSLLSLAGQYAGATLIKTATSTFWLSGDLA
jgi:hypothetical protein